MHMAIFFAGLHVSPDFLGVKKRSQKRQPKANIVVNVLFILRAQSRGGSASALGPDQRLIIASACQAHSSTIR